ncbi:MAG: helix-turn-helix domain-containing protein [Sphaerochaetaceae bacterium]|nr:helix-turn-helix domain-containing protein [Sphaerochaetaceae bacterium]
MKRLVSWRLPTTVLRLAGKRGVSLRELERQSGVRDGYFHQVVRSGRWNPRLDTLESVCDVLDVLASSLMTMAMDEDGDVPEDVLERSKARPGPWGISRYFGCAVRLVRERNGLSLSAMADRTGMDKQNLSHVENRRNGRPVPTVEFVHLLAEGAGEGVAGLMREMERLAEYEAMERRDYQLFLCILDIVDKTVGQ